MQPGTVGIEVAGTVVVVVATVLEMPAHGFFCSLRSCAVAVVAHATESVAKRRKVAALRIGVAPYLCSSSRLSATFYSTVYYSKFDKFVNRWCLDRLGPDAVQLQPNFPAMGGLPAQAGLLQELVSIFNYEKK